MASVLAESNASATMRRCATFCTLVKLLKVVSWRMEALPNLLLTELKIFRGGHLLHLLRCRARRIAEHRLPGEGSAPRSGFSFGKVCKPEGV